MRRDQCGLKAFWGDRKESLDSCASRAAFSLADLATCDEAFTRWIKPGTFKKGADNRFYPTHEALRDLLAKGRNRRDSDHSVIEDLGYSANIWNGDSGAEAAGVSSWCGAYPHCAGLPVPNNFGIDLPSVGPIGERILRVEMLQKIMKVVVTIWDPDWARVTSGDLLGIIFDREGTLDMIGWLTYFSNRYGALPSLPPKYDLVPIEGFGTIIVIRTDGRFSAKNADHLEAVRELGGLLTKAGKLIRTPPVEATV